MFFLIYKTFFFNLQNAFERVVPRLNYNIKSEIISDWQSDDTNNESNEKENLLKEKKAESTRDYLVSY